MKKNKVLKKYFTEIDASNGKLICLNLLAYDLKELNEKIEFIMKDETACYYIDTISEHIYENK